VRRAVCLLGLLLWPAAASGASLALTEGQRQEAIRAGERSVTAEAFGAEWSVAGPAGERAVVLTPFHRLAIAARHARFGGKALKPGDRDKVLREARDRLVFWVSLRGGSPDILAEVLDHNFQDVVSLALLEAELCRLRGGGWREARVLDPRGMALDLLRAGAVDDALELVESAQHLAADPAEANALRRVASRLLLATGRVDRAEELWAHGTRRASADAANAWIEVARIRERHRGDLPGALEAAAAASRVLDIAFALGRGGDIGELGRVRLRVESRVRRLRRWTAAAERRAARDERAVA